MKLCQPRAILDSVKVVAVAFVLLSLTSSACASKASPKSSVPASVLRAYLVDLGGAYNSYVRASREIAARRDALLPEGPRWAELAGTLKASATRHDRIALEMEQISPPSALRVAHQNMVKSVRMEAQSYRRLASALGATAAAIASGNNAKLDAAFQRSDEALTVASDRWLKAAELRVGWKRQVLRAAKAAAVQAPSWVPNVESSQ